MSAEHEAALQAVAGLSASDRDIVVGRLRLDADIASGHVGRMMGGDQAARAEVYRSVAALVEAVVLPLSVQPEGVV